MHRCQNNSAFFNRGLDFKGIFWSMLIFQEQQLIDFQIGVEIMSWLNSNVLIWRVISNYIKRTEIILRCDSNQIIPLDGIHIWLALSIDWDETTTWLRITVLVVLSNPNY